MRTPAATALLAAALAALRRRRHRAGGAPPRFGPAEQVPSPVSTAGWEDSGGISPDGTRLYFTYLRMDPVVFLTGSAQHPARGPLRPGWPTLASYDTIGASSTGVTWSTARGLTGAPRHHHQPPRGAGGRRVGLGRRPADPLHQWRRRRAAGAYGIYYAEQLNGMWQPAVLASSVGFPFVSGDENPHLTLDEQTLFFESSRPGGQGCRTSGSVHPGTGPVEAPVPVPATVNTPGRGSPSASTAPRCTSMTRAPAAASLYSRRTAAGWTRARVVVAGAVGDPSLTLSGDLYFIGGGPCLAASTRISSWRTHADFLSRETLDARRVPHRARPPRAAHAAPRGRGVSHRRPPLAGRRRPAELGGDAGPPPLRQPPALHRRPARRHRLRPRPRGRVPRPARQPGRAGSRAGGHRAREC
ncbi:MAG: PD40 domain-containing protein [Gemmatimonadetes bacterium]|nr:PD40 domain-containing protein [Gemmatimonadota bacterium]